MKTLKVDILLTDAEIDYLLSVDWENEDEWVADGMMFAFTHLESMGILLDTQLDKHGRYARKRGKYRVCLSTLGERVLKQLKENNV
mgnify:FL=1